MVKCLKHEWARLFLPNACVVVAAKMLKISTWILTRLHLPHAIVVRLHVHKSNVVILTPETAVDVGV